MTKKANPWVKKIERQRLMGNKLNPFAAKASRPSSSRQASRSSNGSGTVRLDAGRAKINPQQLTLGMEAGDLNTPYVGTKEPKYWRKDRVDTSHATSGQKVEVTVDDNRGVRGADGYITYADGLWLNILRTNGGNTPCFRPQITRFEVIEDVK